MADVNKLNELLNSIMLVFSKHLLSHKFHISLHTECLSSDHRTMFICYKLIQFGTNKMQPTANLTLEFSSEGFKYMLY